MMYDLGRRHAHDPHDHPLELARRPAAASPLSRPYFYWYNYFNRDQTGGTCVANSAAHVLGDSPKQKPLGFPGAGGVNRTASITQRVASAIGASFDDLIGYRSLQSGQDGVRGYLYDEAQKIDEWADTPPESGTSFRAMCKVLQRVGLISAYVWIAALDDLVKSVIDYGPVAFGCELTEGMYPGATPIPSGGWWHHTGNPVGGHEFVLDGANATLRKFRVQTWGTHYLIGFDDVAALLAEPTTDACLVTEL